MPQPLYIAFVWHMHQPYYRDLVSGECSMPWVRLHATKDYVDMVTRLKPFPSIHQTFNLVPSLLDQLEEYLPPANRSDACLELSRKPAAQLSEQDQRLLLQWGFMANLERMIKPFPRYHDLLAKRGVHVSESDWPRILKRFQTQDYLDLQVWFNLAWIDPWLRRQDPRLAALETKGSHFSEEEKCLVLERHLALIAQVIPAYREASARGQIELACSPYYHPIMPLLCDTRAAQAALPHLPLPEIPFRRPDDARWHLREGIRRHQAVFGAAPSGVWPSEGGVSEALVELACEAGVRWIATDEEILWRTLKRPRALSTLYRPHALRREGGVPAIVFRDRELSDLIGFVYSQWDPQAAVADFLKRLGAIHQQMSAAAQPGLVSIILDGENAWEFYTHDGHDFLAGLYQALSQDSRFRCVTVSEFLQRYPVEGSEPLPELFSGSWIDANFATWIGHPEKNAAWKHLANARTALEPFSREDPSRATLWNSLGAAEGSDWMWWFGDTHVSAQAEEFDRLFRVHVSNCYRLAGLDVPEALAAPIRQRIAAPLYGPTGAIHPTIDGRESSYYEWLYAGRLDLQQQYSAIQRSEQCLGQLFYGFDAARLYVRIDADPARLARLSAWSIELTVSGLKIRIAPEGAPGRLTLRARSSSPGSPDLPCAIGRILELAVPLDLLALKPGEKPQLTISVLDGELPLERYPAQGAFTLNAPSDVDALSWPL